MLSKWANEEQVGNFYCDFFVYLKSRFPACPGGIYTPTWANESGEKRLHFFASPFMLGKRRVNGVNEIVKGGETALIEPGCAITFRLFGEARVDR